MLWHKYLNCCNDSEYAVKVYPTNQALEYISLLYYT